MNNQGYTLTVNNMHDLSGNALTEVVKCDGKQSPQGFIFSCWYIC